ncbi:Arginase family enzyme [Pustulibacterium marinum]|uniref:Arginase family enzyme n=1 Tax=Pustulibacterium marinum TaxID=1224947 RepID=A0A1I7GS69_9FLAO|nr:formimidoylglutamase [Pustulibacterium marinum]SFU51231.1 Arginase family enzyme [Pustulibacterium marinum]
MSLEFLSPIAETVIDHVNNLHPQTLGKTIRLHSQAAGMPDLDQVKIAIISVEETRNAGDSVDATFHPDTVRKAFYELFSGNWNQRIADLGNLSQGAQVTDTYYALKEVVATLVKQGIVPIVIGGSQDLTYAMYRAYDHLEQMVNLVAIDHSFDLATSDIGITAESYLNNIILDEPNNLHSFTNIGYQSYYNSQEGLDLMQKLFFDVCRLGDVFRDVTIVEPLLRNADVVSLDVQSIQGNDLGSYDFVKPNGLNSREICAVARYAGISDKVSSFGIFNGVASVLGSELLAQIVWYFIEGVHSRFYEYPFTSKEQYTKYNVPMQDEDMVFYKSNKSGRWWVAVSFFQNFNNNVTTEALLPCTNQDYLDACNQIMPERWWKAYQKNMN